MKTSRLRAFMWHQHHGLGCSDSIQSYWVWCQMKPIGMPNLLTFTLHFFHPSSQFALCGRSALPATTARHRHNVKRSSNKLEPSIKKLNYLSTNPTITLLRRLDPNWCHAKLEGRAPLKMDRALKWAPTCHMSWHDPNPFLASLIQTRSKGWPLHAIYMILHIVLSKLLTVLCMIMNVQNRNFD
jgi:hypothetical protein